MAIRATSNSYASANAYTYYNELLGKNSDTGSSAQNTGQNSGQYANQSTGNLSGLLTTQGRAEIKKALEGMKEEGFTSFTFDEIERYRKIQELEFTAQIKEDLAELGVDPDVQFTLVVDASGVVKVISDHEDKAAIEKYLANNPEMVEDFKHIQALSNLKRSQQKGVAQNHELTRNLKATLQAEAVQAFFASTDNNGQDYFSQIANFSGDDASSWYLGLNRKV